MAVGFTLCDAAGLTISACPRYADILGRSVERAIGLTLECVTHPDDIKVNRWLLDQTTGLGDGFTVRKRYLKPGGGVQWVENRVISLGQTDLLPVYIVASCPIPDPRPDDLALSPPGTHARYVADMAEQLACMAKGARLEDAAHLLRFAAAAATVREREDATPDR